MEKKNQSYLPNSNKNQWCQLLQLARVALSLEEFLCRSQGSNSEVQNRMRQAVFTILPKNPKAQIMQMAGHNKCLGFRTSTISGSLVCFKFIMFRLLIYRLNFAVLYDIKWCESVLIKMFRIKHEDQHIERIITVRYTRSQQVSWSLKLSADTSQMHMANDLAHRNIWVCIISNHVRMQMIMEWYP